MSEEEIEEYEENSLYYLANDLKDKVIEEEKILERDLTPLFFKEIEYMIANGEIIIIEVNAKMRLGKSTQAIALGQHVFKLLKKYKHQAPAAKFSMKNIARDQQEKSKMMRNPNLHHTVVVTDESNALENTGENVTIEHALAKVFSDVQAARYVHSINCSPKETIDSNADILLQITSINKKTKTTFNKLYYRFTEGGITRIMLLGHVKINVNELISTWEDKAKKLFYKRNRTPEEEKQLQHYIKTDLYTEYQHKKHEKMNLITHEGIMRPRMLDTADTALDVINRLKGLTKVMKVDRTMIRSLLKEEIRKRKLAISLVGEEQLIRDVEGVTGTFEKLHNITKKRIKLEQLYKQGAIDQYYMEQTDKILKEAQNELAIVAQNQIEELEHYKKVKNKYDLIEK